MEVLSIDYTPTDRSVRAALLSAYTFPKLALWTALSFGGLMALTEIASVDWFSIRAILSWALTYVVAGLLFGSVMALAFRYLFIPLQARTLVRKNPLLFGPSNFKADNEGVKFSTPNSTANFLWSDLRGYEQAKGAVVIATTGSARFALPTSRMTASDLKSLLEFLSVHLPRLGYRGGHKRS